MHLRTKRGWGLARTAHKLGMHPSTVNRVLRREGAALLSEVDLATRKALRGKVKRYEHEAPGDLIHVDVKKLGKIPNGGGHRIHGRQLGRVNTRLMGTVNKTLTGAPATAMSTPPSMTTAWGLVWPIPLAVRPC